MDSLYIQDGVIQKVISLHAWKMIKACKGNFDFGYEISRKEIVQDYLKEYLWIESISDENLYHHLLEVAFEVFDKNKLFDIFKREVARVMFYNHIDKKTLGLKYCDLCEILLNQLDLLQVRELKDQRYVDLFIILDEDNRLLTIDEINMKNSQQLKKEPRID